MINEIKPISFLSENFALYMDFVNRIFPQKFLKLVAN